jgi:hypothetical protein
MTSPKGVLLLNGAIDRAPSNYDAINEGFILCRISPSQWHVLLQWHL